MTIPLQGSLPLLFIGLLTPLLPQPARAQTLLNVDFGVGSRSGKVGFAATGQSTNDFWNLYRHYDPKYVSGMKLVPSGTMGGLKFADRTESKISISVTNAPGVWGNASGDPMFDAYLFAQNGSNIIVRLTGLDPGRYHFYFYGHADPDATGEQNSVFRIFTASTNHGPLTTVSAPGWKISSPWQENHQFVVFRDVRVWAGEPVTIEVAPGPNGVAVLNGLQVSSRGTGPPKLLPGLAVKQPFYSTNIAFHEVRYRGKVSDDEARFTVDLTVESQNPKEISSPLFEGDLALMAPQLPEGLRIASQAREYRLIVSAPGVYRFQLEVVARITRADPWNQISFFGPPAAIAEVVATSAANGVELQLLSGTQLDSPDGVPASAGDSPGNATAGPPKPGTSNLAVLRGFLGPDRTLAMRWQSKTTETTRKSLVTVETVAAAQVTPTVIKFSSQFRYEILQAPVPRLRIALPARHALTKIQGEQIRDWQLKSEGAQQFLTVEFIKPLEKSYALALLTEQPVETAPAFSELAPPQPLEIERESGSFTIAADDMQVEIASSTGLRQVNATSGTLAAYRFHIRPFALTAQLKRIEPVVKTADRITARLEETRLLVSHALALTVEKAGIYSVELAPPTNFVVGDVRGDGVDDWKVVDGKLRVSFAARVLGTRYLAIQLEQAQKTFPSQIVLMPLRVTGATNETAQIGAVAALGIRLKVAGALNNVREIPIMDLASRSDELLAFAAEQPDWQIALAAERLPARVVADVFNLITVGEGLVGGSATIRLGLINQGVQEVRVKLPAHWKNVEFTGPNIRRKETNAPTGGTASDTNYVAWTIALQDKAWGGYTLVVTYDYQFDPKNASLDLRGAHPVGVERESGSVAITTAGSLKLEPKPATDPLRVIDASDLMEADRALITRPVLLAYRYTGDNFALAADVTRHEELPVLDAVADRTQLTSVLTDAGEMLTQASYMVKNNDRQFQRFQLPKGAKFWGCYVNGQPSKAEVDGPWLLVSLPRGLNRDEAFAVDIVYAQQVGALQSRLLPKTVALIAPTTDVPNAYAEWQLYVPPSQRLSGFDGNMTVARGTTYNLRDAWNRFVDCYRDVWRESGRTIIVLTGVAVLLVMFAAHSIRRGLQGAITVLVAFSILAVLAGMMLPALSKAKARASRINAVSDLKQIALAARIWANQHNGQLPPSFEALADDIGSTRVLIDPESGQRFVYAGAGKDVSNPQAIIAYSPVDLNGRAVAFADGSVAQMNSAAFNEAIQRDGLALAQGSHAQPAKAGRVDPVSAAAALAIEQPVNGAGLGDLDRHRHSKFMVGAVTGPAGGVNTPAPISPAPGKPARTVSGLRSIRIDIPRAGREYSFTKVLNVRDEPLAVKLSVMKLKVFHTVRTLLQVVAFISGLAISWREWQRVPRRSLRLTLGLILVFGSIGHLALSSRTLHYLLIVALPIVGVTALGWLIWRLWPRRTESPAGATAIESATPGPGAGPAGAPSAVTLIALLFGLSAIFTGHAAAQAIDPASAPAIAYAEHQIPEPPVPNAVTIVSASYTGIVGEKVARFDAVIQLMSATTNQSVKLFGGDVAIEHFSTDAKDVKLQRHGETVTLSLPARGSVTVNLKLLVKLGGTVAKRQLAFAIPPALSSQLMVVIAEAEADVDFPTAIASRRATDRQTTRVNAVLGAGDHVDMYWTPRVKRITEMAASIFAQNTSLVTVGGGVINTRSVIDYQIVQGELRQARLRFPVDQRLLRVEGELIRTWELSQEGAEQVLTVDLGRSALSAYQLAIETEKLLDKLPVTATLEVPHVQDVIRESGLLGVCGGEELNLMIESAQGLDRIDASDFKKITKGDDVLSAYRFLKPDFRLSARAEAVQPQIEAVVRNDFNVGFEQITLSAQVNYTIKKAGVFSMRLALPAGFKVNSVFVAATDVNPRQESKAGSIQPLAHAVGYEPQWIEKSDPRTLEVSLKERTLGAHTLQIRLSRSHKDLSASIDLAGVMPLDLQKVSGFVAVSSEMGVAVKASAFDGLAEIPAAALGSGSGHGAGSSVLAYKLIGADPQTAALWKLSVSTETVESWVRAEVVSLVSVSETMTSGRALVRYDIQNAPVKEFRLRMPGAWTNVEIFGVNIRQRDQTNNEWRVELQNKVRGTYQLTVSWEQARAGTNSSIEFAGLETIGTERETGAVVFLTKPPLQVVEKAASEQLIRIDSRELPDWAGVSTSVANPRAEAPVLIFRCLRPGYKLTVEAKRFEDAAALQALVDNARLTTVVADDGQMMTEMVLGIRNNGLQHLEIELPNGSTVWSAFVGGQPVRPSQRNGKLLLPMERSDVDDNPIAVELIYVSAERFPRRKGDVNFISPKLDVPLKNARWELYLPPDYDYGKFAGTMMPAVESEPVVQVYSSTEYYRQEERKKDERQSEVKKFLSKARSGIASGKLKEATEELNQAVRLNAEVDEVSKRELSEVRRELGRVQGSNLIQAQRDYTLNNSLSERAGADSASFGLGTLPAQQTGEKAVALVQYDADTAERQWEVLQRAQEVTIAKVQPLRVNLPTRGQRLSFTQILQTEINKPMTIRLVATNAEGIGWFRGLGYTAAGFVLLWILVSVILSRAPSHETIRATASRA